MYSLFALALRGATGLINDNDSYMTMMHELKTCSYNLTCAKLRAKREDGIKGRNSVCEK